MERFPPPRPDEMGEQPQLPLGLSTERILIYTEYGMKLVGNGGESEDELGLFYIWLKDTHSESVANKIWRNIGLMGG